MGPMGTAGASGPPGANGAAGWAYVQSFSSGTIVACSSNITQNNVVPASGNPGVLCFQNLPFRVHAVIAIATPTYGFAQYNLTIVTAAPNSIASGCPKIGSMDFYDAAFVTGYYMVNGVNGGPQAATVEGVSVLFF